MMGEEAPEQARDNVVRLRTAGVPGPDPVALLEQAIRVTTGIASLVVEVALDVVARTVGYEQVAEEEVEDEEPKLVRGLPLLAGAAIGLAWETGRWGARTVSAVGRSVAPLASFAASPGFVRRRLTAFEGRLTELNARWGDVRPRSEEAAEAFARALVPRVVEAALDRIDLTELVLQRVDIERVVSSVDLDAAVERVDLEAVVARLDLDGVVDRVDVERIIDRVDLDRVVGRVDIAAIVDRVDLDAVASRIDLDAIVGRLDLAAIANQVIEEIDLAAIIRDATMPMAAEAVEGIRVQSMDADRFVAGLVDRMLRRHRDAAGEQTAGGEEGGS